MNSILFGIGLQNLIQNASSIRETVLSDTILASAGKCALALALFFFVYVLLEVSMKLLSGQQFPWMDIMKPFMLVLVVLNWGPLIHTVDVVGEFLNDNVSIAFDSKSADAANARYREGIMSAIEHMDGLDKEFDFPSAGSSDASGDLGLGMSVSDPTKFNEDKLAKKIGRAIKSIFIGSASFLNIGTSLFLLMKMVIGEVLAVLSQFYLIVLGIIGPFAFAFAIVPSLNRISQWIGTYLQYWLWVPMINIVEAIMSRFSGQVALLRGFTNAGNGGLSMIKDSVRAVVEIGDKMGPAQFLEFSNIATIACIFMLLAIPKLARLVIHAGEDVLSANLGRFASQAASKAVDVGKAVATGGTSSLAKAASNVVK